MSKYIALLKPKEITASSQLTIYGDLDSLTVVFDGIKYSLRAGVLQAIDDGGKPSDRLDISIHEFDKTVDKSLFSTEGMRRVSFLLGWSYDGTWLKIIGVLLYWPWLLF